MGWRRPLAPDERAFVEARIAFFERSLQERGIAVPAPTETSEHWSASSLSAANYLAQLRALLTEGAPTRFAPGAGTPVHPVPHPAPAPEPDPEP